MKSTTIWAVILIVIAGAILLYVFAGNDDMTMDDDAIVNSSSTGQMTNDQNNVTGDTDATSSADSAATVPSVMIGDNDAGIVSSVLYANLPTEGFIALYNVNSQGEVKLVGNSELLPAGIHQDVSIQTTQSMVQDQSLVAIVFADTDNDGEFMPQESDMPLRTIDGIIVTDIDIVGRADAAETDEQLEQVQEAIEENMEEEA